MGVLLDHGMENIEKHVKKLDTLLINGLIKRGFKIQTPMEEHRRIFLNVIMPDPKKAVEKLQTEGVVVSAREGGVRITPHFYNTEEEVERFFNIWDKVA